MFPDRVNTSNIIKGAKRPELLVREVKRLAFSSFNRTVGKWHFTKKHGTPIDVMSKDWDNLILIDACRYDIFREYNFIEGDLTEELSVASHSDGFIQEAFNGRELHDTVYITVNPHADKTLNDEVFHKVIKTYTTTEFSERKFENIHPKRVTEAAISNYERFDDKRIIVHFMQPHSPYFGPTAESLRRKLAEKNIKLQFISDDADYDYKSLLEAAIDDHITDEELRTCYIENLETVLSEVQRVLNTFEGKSVITSDHGELLGDPDTILPVVPKYTHPKNMFLSELRTVPWLTIESDTRRQIVSEEPRPEDTANREQVENQLEALGYLS